MHMRICHTDCQHTYLCWKADQDPSSCSPCPSNEGEDAACEDTDQSSFEETLVQIEDVSRNTTIAIACRLGTLHTRVSLGLLKSDL